MNEIISFTKFGFEPRTRLGCHKKYAQIKELVSKYPLNQWKELIFGAGYRFLLLLLALL